MKFVRTAKIFETENRKLTEFSSRKQGIFLYCGKEFLSRKDFRSELCKDASRCSVKNKKNKKNSVKASLQWVKMV